MTVKFDVPDEMREAIQQIADERSITPEESLLALVEDALFDSARYTPAKSGNGADLVRYWRRHGVIGAWTTRPAPDHEHEPGFPVGLEDRVPPELLGLPPARRRSPAEAVDDWKANGVLGMWNDQIGNRSSVEFARALRRRGERRHWDNPDATR